jgi:hypothetical protein
VAVALLAIRQHYGVVLREGLRAEIPAVFDLAARSRRPVAPAMAPLLAGIGALGVESLTVAVIRTVQSAGLYATGTYPLRNSEPVLVVGYALAIIFAFGVARWRGATAAIGLFAIILIEQAVLNAPGRQTFCERSGSPCDWAAIYWPQLWPELLGITVGILAVRAVRHGGPGIAALALGIAVFVLSFSVGRLAFVPFLGAAPVGEAGREAANVVVVAELLGALAAGYVIGRFGRRHVFDAAVLIVYFLGPWSPQLRVPDLFFGGFHLEKDWQVVIPVGYALAGLIGLAVAVLQRRYFATSIPTIP